MDQEINIVLEYLSKNELIFEVVTKKDVEEKGPTLKKLNPKTNEITIKNECCPNSKPLILNIFVQSQTKDDETSESSSSDSEDGCYQDEVSCDWETVTVDVDVIKQERYDPYLDDSDYEDRKPNLEALKNALGCDEIPTPKRKYRGKNSSEPPLKKVSEYSTPFWYLPPGLTLPDLTNLRTPYNSIIPQDDGTIVYISKRSGKPIRITNFDQNRTDCDICLQPVQNLPGLIQHRKHFHFFPNRGNTCEGCGQSFEMEEDRKNHTYFCLKKDTISGFSCIRCNFKGTGVEDLMVHRAQFHKKKKSYKKKIGEVSIKTETPIESQESRREYLCYLCSETFKCRRVLNRHMLRHSDPKPFKCHHCSEAFLSRASVYVHLVRAHFPEEAKFVCQTCEPPILFVNINPYKAHINAVHLKIDSGPKEPCNFCGKMFKRGTLKQHIYKMHTTFTDKKRYDCQQCDKFFFTKGGLKSHALVHLPEDQKRFKCRFCQQGFNHKKGWIEHERSHTGEKPYECQVCGKAYARRQVYVDHMKLHTGDGYQCSVCPAKFIDRGNYRHHMKQHENQMGVKLTYNPEERRLMKLRVLTEDQVLSKQGDDVDVQ